MIFDASFTSEQNKCLFKRTLSGSHSLQFIHHHSYKFPQLRDNMQKHEWRMETTCVTFSYKIFFLAHSRLFQIRFLQLDLRFFLV